MQKQTLVTGLVFHPHRDRKIGLGIKDIKAMLLGLRFGAFWCMQIR
ncbi:hypothetical protein RchiOBHm_Chr7g0191321 [Rosa chinensis]|uniref:Uncharacterized protein n=1 Tax=Rosa chinensis TaxID=74649 RepID=A0A2P6P586_ROSCH|nr:hypothetical protein RchiOBHm_Chr7g0191321 [Rosa chinensis]